MNFETAQIHIFNSTFPLSLKAPSRTNPGIFETVYRHATAADE